MKLPSLSEIRKFAVTVVGLGGVVVSSGQLAGYTHTLAIVNDIIGVATAATVYIVPNGKGGDKIDTAALETQFLPVPVQAVVGDVERYGVEGAVEQVVAPVVAKAETEFHNALGQVVKND